MPRKRCTSHRPAPQRQAIGPKASQRVMISLPAGRAPGDDLLFNPPCKPQSAWGFAWATICSYGNPTESGGPFHGLESEAFELHLESKFKRDSCNSWSRSKQNQDNRTKRGNAIHNQEHSEDIRTVAGSQHQRRRVLGIGSRWKYDRFNGSTGRDEGLVARPPPVHSRSMGR